MPADRLVLVRHGESIWNAEGRLQGQADPPLSERGRRQAADLRRWLRAFAPGRVVTSDLRRARETAALLGGPEAEPDPRWREIDLGDWTGRLAAEVRAEDADAFRDWRSGLRPAPGGEAYPDFGARVLEAARDLLAAPETTLVVAHGGPIRMLCAGLLGTDLRRLAGVGNGSATVIEPGPAGPRLAGYNLGGEGGEVL